MSESAVTTGVILIGEHPDMSVLAVLGRMRLILALQAVGVKQILLAAGTDIAAREAKNITTYALIDARVKVAILSRGAGYVADSLVVRDTVIVDTKRLRALRDAGPGFTLSIEGSVVAAYVADDGETLETLGANDVQSTEGVLVLCHEPAHRKAASRALLDSLRKPQDGWVSRAINRNISLAFTSVLVSTGISPNVLSVVILLIGLAGAFCAAQGTWAMFALGGFLFQAQSVLDGCDGEISRLTFRGSRMGEWLDTVGDDLTNYGFFAGAGVGLMQAGPGNLALWVCLWGVGVGMVASGIEYRYLIRIGSGDLLKYPLGFGNDPEPTVAPTGIAKVLGAIRPAFKRDFFVFATMIAAMAGPWVLFVMCALFSIGATATLGAVINSEFRRVADEEPTRT